MAAQSALVAEDGIRRRLGGSADGFGGAGALLRLAVTHIVGGPGRVAANHTEVVAGVEAFMGGTGREHGDVAGLQVNFDPVRSAELHAGRPGEDTQDLVGIAVIVVERIDAITPEPSPTVFTEHLLDRTARVIGSELDRAAVEKQGPAGVVGKISIIAQMKDPYLG